MYEEEKKSAKLRFNNIDLHWLTQNFVRLLNSLIHDYYIEYEKSNALNISDKNSEVFGKSLNTLKLPNDWVDARPDPNQTIHPESEGARSKAGSRTSDRSKTYSVEEMI